MIWTKINAKLVKIVVPFVLIMMYVKNVPILIEMEFNVIVYKDSMKTLLPYNAFVIFIA